PRGCIGFERLLPASRELVDAPALEIRGGRIRREIAVEGGVAARARARIVGGRGAPARFLERAPPGFPPPPRAPGPHPPVRAEARHGRLLALIDARGGLRDRLARRQQGDRDQHEDRGPHRPAPRAPSAADSASTFCRMRSSTASAAFPWIHACPAFLRKSS